MAVKETVTLTDSTLTPEAGTPAAVPRDFNPGSVENGYVHTFHNSTTGLTSASRSKLTASLRRANATRPTDRIRFVLSLPQVQTVDGIDTVAHTNLVQLEFVFHKDTSRDNRRDARAMFSSLFSEASLLSMVQDLEDLY
jgi:hypothetical protein